MEIISIEKKTFEELFIYQIDITAVITRQLPGNDGYHRLLYPEYQCLTWFPKRLQLLPNSLRYPNCRHRDRSE